jgi:hypothetical protein
MSLYATLWRHAEEIELTAAEMKMKVPVRPLLGTLAKGPINAMAIQACPTNDYIIAFQQAIFWFSMMTSTALTPILPKVEDLYTLKYSLTAYSIDTEVNAHLDAYEILIKLPLTYLVNGRPVGIHPLVLPEETQQAFAAALVEGMNRFIMGHEYAHIILRHISPCNAERTPKEVLRSQTEEFEADRYGFYLAMVSQREYQRTAYVAIDMLLTYMDLIEKGMSLLVAGHEGTRIDSSHPSPSKRRAAIREEANKL